MITRIKPRNDAQADHIVAALRSILAERERELFELKGPCRFKACALHYAHFGPCNIAAPRLDARLKATTNDELAAVWDAGATAGAQFQWEYERTHSTSALRHLDNPYRRKP